MTFALNVLTKVKKKLKKPLTKKTAGHYVMLCAIWYHLYKLKNVKNTHGRALLLVKLQL